MAFCDCWKPSILVTNHIIMLYLMETLEFIFKMLFEATHLNQQLQSLKQLFIPFSFQPMKWNSVHTKIRKKYFEEIFNITYVVSVLVCFQLKKKKGKLYPNWFTEWGNVCTWPFRSRKGFTDGTVSVNPPFISYTWSCFILRSASLIGERLGQSWASQQYKVTYRGKVCLFGGRWGLP